MAEVIVGEAQRIRITAPDGVTVEFPRGVTGRDVVATLFPEKASEAVGIVVNGTIYDLSRQLQEDATVRVLTFDDPEGMQVFWHSSAHLMAEALELLYPGIKFAIGPPIENGFYYDVEPPEGTTITADDLPRIEQVMRELAQRDVPFERFEVSWEEAVDYYRRNWNPYKLEILEELRGQPITFYRQGNFTDLCKGTHVPSTGMLRYPKLLSVAGAYWRGDSRNKMLTRIYGICFPREEQLEAFLQLREEAERRDHRKLGRELELFLLTPAVGPGLPIWLPNGTVLRRTLENFLRREQLKRGYQEVITPHIGNLELYKTSGHYPYYADSQFPPMELDEREQYLLKPMNCPHHHQIYASKPRSYRELPLRLAEFGTVYRYEQSGELNGLIRVRGFTQDDAHIYCTPEQLKDEIKAVVELTQYVFRCFGMPVDVRLSFRDDNDAKYGGDKALWERAQREIQEVADEMGLQYQIGLGEAAFYGPKIDFIVRDALGRRWQLGTVQVDYVMPERFRLEYIGPDGQPHRPVIIHRAPFGSLERFVGILIEHYAGNFPFWLAPVQAMVLPITDAQHAAAMELAQRLQEAGYRVQVDLRSERLQRKIAESEHRKIPFLLILGRREVEAGTVAVRRHGLGDQGVRSVEEVVRWFAELNVPGAEGRHA
ncbi:MAG: threonine--tRNA ligase [Candidatus Kapabacteria bacterium]|nr:threonine--tRNA ligase [Candidatus Kapabacteria bacterium]MDW8012099.1 threonine--tRNA ligase [Bacteroidota bacterium]